jgi:hypothetical protein
VISDAGKHIDQPSLWIHVVHLGRLTPPSQRALAFPIAFLQHVAIRYRPERTVRMTVVPHFSQTKTWPSERLRIMFGATRDSCIALAHFGQLGASMGGGRTGHRQPFLAAI